MTQDYPKPIAPSPELVREWWVDANAMADIPYEPVVRDRKAERARVEQIPGYGEARQNALQMLNTIERDAHYLPEITDTIRRALEQLDG